MTDLKRHLLIGGALILVGALAMNAAYATDVRVTCVAPTEFVDGTPIGTAPITFNLYGGTVGQTPKPLLASGSAACNFTRTNVRIGTHEYHVTATVGGQESGPSESRQITVAQPAPKAPSGVTVITITVEAP